jgi:Zn finger protein HypA/HybF involved in hydrogenase expression
MHDTHLIEKIYESIAEICRRNAIVRVNDLHIEVDEGSHITEPLLLEHLKDRDGTLFGTWTDVHVDYQPFEKLTAVITGIDGDSSNDHI